MPLDIPEADWKVFKRIHPLALERFCDRALSEVGYYASEPKATAHERYLAVMKAVKERDRALAEMFDDYRRSTAYFMLARMWREKLVTADEFASLSPASQQVLWRLAAVGQG